MSDLFTMKTMEKAQAKNGDDEYEQKRGNQEFRRRTKEFV